MNQCLIYDSSLRVSRAIYGLMVLAAFLMQNQWLVFITAFLIMLGSFSMKLNIMYQLHYWLVIRMLDGKKEPIQKESAEINFVSGMTALLLFVGFLLLSLGKFNEAVWIYILVVDLLIFLACFVGFCVATLMYIFFKKIFKF